jgi:ACS family tartrate transporter-like MFS transporter
MFLIEALPSLLMAFALFYYLTDRPSMATWLTSDERKWLQDRLDAERTNREMFFSMTWFKSMIAPRVLSLGIAYFCQVVPLFGLSFFLPQIVKDFGLTNVQAGLVTAIPYLVATIGMVQWGSHSDRTCERKWHAVIFFAAMSSGLAFAAMTASPIVKMTFLCKLGIRPPGRRNCSIYYGWRNQPECRLCHVNPPLSEATIIRRRNRYPCRALPTEGGSTHCCCRRASLFSVASLI